MRQILSLKRYLTALILGMCLLAPVAQATIEALEFQNESLRSRYQELAAVLRCPKCQNQNIIDSDAPIAADLRKQVHRLLHEGYRDEEILDFMVARYGNFVLYEPPVNRLTYLLWFGPAGLVVLATVVVALIVRSRRTVQKQRVISDQERARLNALLQRQQDGDSSA